MPEPCGDIAVSVVVPCRNPGSHLRSMLESLVQQRFDKGWEVILVDNGGCDTALSGCRPLLGRLNLRVVPAFDRSGASYARNVGARQASGRKILFVDADDEVDRDYVATMAAALDDHPLVTSRVDSSSLNPEWVRDAHGPPWQETGLVTFFGFLPGTGSNIGLRRELLEEAGPIPEDFQASEDIAFSWRLQIEKGVTPRFVAEALYRYRYRSSLWGLLRQGRCWGESNVLLFRRFRCAGMPGRSWSMAAEDWWQVVNGLLRARTRKDLAPVAVRAGNCIGRIAGSLRYRTIYL